MTTASDRTAHFRHLHAQGLLRLANAWDAGTARIIAALDAPAIATTSAGVAWAHGYPDGDHLPISRMLATVADIARVIDVPLTVDAEGGYADDPDSVADTVLALVRHGASGINLEDGSAEPLLLCAKIRRIRERCRSEGLDVFINARTDVYLRQLAPTAETCVAESLRRGALYREAGADGLFVPGVTEETEIAALAADAGLPLNVLWRAQLPETERLQALGVRRLSAGSDLAQSTAGHLARRAQAFLQQPRMQADERLMIYGELNALFPAP